MHLRAYNKDEPDKERTFMVETRKDEYGDIEIHMGDIQSNRGACIFIIADKKRGYATLETVSYRPSCDMQNRLEPNKGTILMLQVALKYICKKYEWIQYVTLNDKSTVPSGKIHITAKRLLQGRDGWYGEYLQAVPDIDDKSTERLMKQLALESTKQKIREYLPITSQKSWGVDEDIIEFAPKILGNNRRAVIGTAWKIWRKDIQEYPVRFHRVHDRQQTGGDSSSSDYGLAANKHRMKLFNLWHRM